MTAKDFVSKWQAVVRQSQAEAEAEEVPGAADDLQLVTASSSILSNPFIPTDAALFLVEAGLPRSCAPFLDFSAVLRGPQTLVEHLGSGTFRPADLPHSSLLYVLGADGAGNPLCLDSAHGGEIVLLDHEDHFQTWTFVASSVATLAEALLVAHTLPRADFAEHLRAFDPRAAEPTAFLPVEINTLGN